MTRLVILESPYAGDVEANVAYARARLLDSLHRGEAPIGMLAARDTYDREGLAYETRTIGVPQ